MSINDPTGKKDDPKDPKDPKEDHEAKEISVNKGFRIKFSEIDKMTEDQLRDNLKKQTTWNQQIEEKITKLETKIELEKQQTEKQKTLEELRQINPILADKYKDDSAQQLKVRLEMVKELGDGLTSIDQTETEPASKTKGYIDPRTGERAKSE